MKNCVHATAVLETAYSQVCVSCRHLYKPEEDSPETQRGYESLYRRFHKHYMFLKCEDMKRTTSEGKRFAFGDQNMEDERVILCFSILV